MFHSPKTKQTHAKFLNGYLFTYQVLGHDFTLENVGAARQGSDFTTEVKLCIETLAPLEKIEQRLIITDFRRGHDITNTTDNKSTETQLKFVHSYTSTNRFNISTL